MPPEFSNAIDTSTADKNKILSKSDRASLAWDVLRRIPMIFCAYPGCSEGYTLCVFRLA